MRVLDLSRLLPGPYCTRILADFGAEVIKVEGPSGWDWVRYAPPLAENGEGLLFLALHRGKKSLTLNLRAREGREIFLRLVETADVLVESFRPGAMERRRLGYEVLAETNPRLVYCSLSGYGLEGPYRKRAGHDINYLGLTGLLDLTGRRNEPPCIPGSQLADLSGALWATVGILQALLERERTGRGQRVDTTLLGGALSLLPVAMALQAGGQRVARGTTDLGGGRVCYNAYECADGQYITLGTLEPEFWTSFCTAVGREDLVAQQLAPAVPGEPAYEEVRALFRSRTRAEWVELLASVDTCCEPLYSLEEALASEPVQALGMLSAQGLLPPVRLSSLPLHAPEPAARLGEHTAELLAELGYGAEEVGKLRDRGIV